MELHHKNYLSRVWQTRQALDAHECECFSVSIKGSWISVPCFINVLCLHASVSGCKRTSILVRRVLCARWRISLKAAPLWMPESKRCQVFFLSEFPSFDVLKWIKAKSNNASSVNKTGVKTSNCQVLPLFTTPPHLTLSGFFFPCHSPRISIGFVISIRLPKTVRVSTRQIASMSCCAKARFNDV